MPNNTYRKVLILGILCLIGILGYQAYLITNFNKLSDKEREDNVIASLYSVIDELYSINPDAGKIVNPVKKVSQGYYRVQVNDTLHPFLLEELLKQGFAAHNISSPFEYAIYDCFTDSTVYASRVDPNSPDNQKTKYLEKIKWQSDGHYFGVFFPKFPNARLNIPDLMLLSLIMLGFLLLFFGYSLIAITREKRLHRVKQDFINNVTHQLKTPVSALTLGIAALSKQHQSATLDLMAKEVKRLAVTINKVLITAKTESNENQGRFEMANPSDIIKNWAKEKSEVNISVEGIDEQVLINREKIILALEILLENSVQHNDMNEMEASIKVSIGKYYWWIDYRDNGKGIVESELKQIFKKFYSASKTDINDPRSGFGLGLSIAKENLRKIGAKISAKPSNTGAHFHIKFRIK